MTMKLIKITVLVIILSVPLLLFGQGTEEKPNIILFVVDDMGWKDLGCYGSDFYETPSVDKLSEEGLTFTRAYVAHPRCVPSRFALMTGKYPSRNGIPNSDKKGGFAKKTIETEMTFGEGLLEGGYTTYYSGKWHLSHNDKELPENKGFDVCIAAGAAGAPRNYFYPYNEIKRNGQKKKDPIRHLDEGEEGEYLTDRLTDEAVNFLNNNAKSPFLMVLSHYAVHEPLEAKKALTKKYRQKVKSMDKSPEQPEYIEEGAGKTKMIQDNPVYAGMVESVDESLGRIMATLESLGIDDNTIIIFTSDHGGLSNNGSKSQNRNLATSNAPLRAGKGWLYEGGIRVPLIIKWPGKITPGTKTDEAVINTDIFPTLLEMAGLELLPEAHIDGRSMVPVIEGKTQKKRTFFWHSPRARPYSTGDYNSTAIMIGDYKLIDWFDQGRVELYNIKNDIGEQNNLAESEKKRCKKMLKKLDKAREEIIMK